MNYIDSWCHRWQLSVNIKKSLILHLGKSNSHFQYHFSNSLLPSPVSTIDLGVLIHQSLSFSSHISSIVAKARARCAIFLKRFVSRDPKLMTKFFISYVRPLLEFSSPVWSPISSFEINLLEGVQRYFTSRIRDCTGLPYHVRLSLLSLHSLYHRRLVTDILTLHSHLTANAAPPLLPHLSFFPPSIARGHNLKLFLPITHYKSHAQNFLSRLSSTWNSLPLSLFVSSQLSTRHNLSNYLSDPFFPPHVPP